MRPSLGSQNLQSRHSKFPGILSLVAFFLFHFCMSAIILILFKFCKCLCNFRKLPHIRIIFLHYTRSRRLLCRLHFSQRASRERRHFQSSGRISKHFHLDQLLYCWNTKLAYPCSPEWCLRSSNQHQTLLDTLKMLNSLNLLIFRNDIRPTCKWKSR
jgi:hypothetical protein